MTEIWKDIGIIKGIDYTGYYQVSNLGRIKSLDRKGFFGKQYITYKGKILKCTVSPTVVYKLAMLSKNSKTTTYLLHRLVAQVFISNPLNKKQINHKDGNKLNNIVDNLEWCSRNENLEHAYKTGLTNYNHAGKKIMMVDNDGKGIMCFYSMYQASTALNIHHGNLTEALNKKYPNRKTAGGYRWKLIKKGE